MIPLAVLILRFAAVQQPPAEELQLSLSSRDPALRRSAAAQLAAEGSDTTSWLLRELDKGTRPRRRAVLLALAVSGDPEGLAAVERMARRGLRPGTERAWALLLYGAFHPEAPRNAADDLGHTASVFEQNCLLAGLLAQARDLPPLAESRRGRKDEAQNALRLVLAALAGRPWETLPDNAVAFAAGTFVSLLAPGAALPAAEFQTYRQLLPELWLQAAARSPARSIDELRSVPTGGAAAGLALVIYEMPAETSEQAFQVLSERLFEPHARAWLWGAAGDRGLNFPPGVELLSNEEVAGVLRLALTDPAKAERAIQSRRPAARRRLHADASLLNEWPAAALLALSPELDDLELLRRRTEQASGWEAQLLQPIWEMASGRIDEEAARRRWLRYWSRELGAGATGYLDREGRRWTAFLLVSGTRAATERLELSDSWLEQRTLLDHPADDEIYTDLAEFLLSQLYRWDLP